VHGKVSPGLDWVPARSNVRPRCGLAHAISRLREHPTILGSVFNTAGVGFQGRKLSASPFVGEQEPDSHWVEVEVFGGERLDSLVDDLDQPGSRFDVGVGGIENRQ
jgi:hypothetical protein